VLCKLCYFSSFSDGFVEHQKHPVHSFSFNVETVIPNMRVTNSPSAIIYR
jgi:hypothetical protein